MDYGLAIRVTDHIVMKDNATQARELGAAGLERIESAFPGLLGPLLQLAVRVLGLVKAAIRPVAMRTQDRGELAGPGRANRARWSIQVAADIMARQARGVDVFY